MEAPGGPGRLLRAAVRSLLELHELSLVTAAEAAGTIARSLQRELASRGMTFAALVDDLRFELAAEWLRDPSAKVVEVASYLGYTDSANFTRAFRRWTGVAPTRFRRAVIERELAS
jgi:AraC-like DNA-binding protein